MRTALVLLTLAISLVFATLYNTNAALADSFGSFKCKSGYDCGPDECSLIGWSRYSVPRCASLGKQGDRCIVGQLPDDKVLVMANNTLLTCQDVYTGFCPCGPKLTCVASYCRRIGKTNKSRKDYGELASGLAIEIPK